MCGTVDYPDLDCGGRITMVKKEPATITLTEETTYGNPSCANQIEILLRWINGSTWEATYTFENKVVASGFLTESTAE
jgi:hypothetical protein